MSWKWASQVIVERSEDESQAGGEGASSLAAKLGQLDHTAKR